MSKDKGSILLESIVALMICVLISNVIYSLVRFKAQCNYFIADIDEVKEIWEVKARCKIYCPKKDPIVDLP